MTDFLKIAKSIAVHFAHICAYGVETVKELSLYLSLPVVVQLLHGIIAVTERGDQVRFDSHLVYYSMLKSAELK